MHLLGESIQEMTLYAWPKVYGKTNEYDRDSRDVLNDIREWAEEFENDWQKKIAEDEKYGDTHDHIGELYKFADAKIREYNMRSYCIDFTCVASLGVCVEASSEEEAIKIAKAQALATPTSEWAHANVDVDSIKRY